MFRLTMSELALNWVGRCRLYRLIKYPQNGGVPLASVQSWNFSCRCQPSHSERFKPYERLEPYEQLPRGLGQHLIAKGGRTLVVELW
jgi:hypothetical protein